MEIQVCSLRPPNSFSGASGKLALDLRRRDFVEFGRRVAPLPVNDGNHPERPRRLREPELGHIEVGGESRLWLAGAGSPLQEVAELLGCTDIDKPPCRPSFATATPAPVVGDALLDGFCSGSILSG